MTEIIKYSEQIKNQFPNEWLLIGNPQYNNSTLIGGFILYHSKDKKEVCYIGRDKTSDFSKVTLLYTGNFKSTRKNGILKRI
jgi:hypothetical protein